MIKQTRSRIALEALYKRAVQAKKAVEQAQDTHSSAIVQKKEQFANDLVVAHQEFDALANSFHSLLISIQKLGAGPVPTEEEWAKFQVVCKESKRIVDEYKPGKREHKVYLG